MPKGLQTAALEDLREGSPSWRYGQGLADQVKGFVFHSKRSRTPTKGFKQGNNVHIVTWEIALAAAQSGSCQGSAWRRDSSAFQDPHLHLLWPYPIQASAQPIGLLPREPDPFSLLYLPDKASPSDLIWGLLISCAYRELSSECVAAKINSRMCFSVNPTEALLLAFEMSSLWILSVCLWLLLLNPHWDLEKNW